MTSGVLRLTTPFSPNHPLSVPSAAFSEYSLPVVDPKTIDAGSGRSLPPPGQYAMPRFDGSSLPGSVNLHFWAPVVASSATTAPYGEPRYIVLPITIGIASSSFIGPVQPSGLR